MSNAYIRHIEYDLPQNTLDNTDLEKLYPEWSAEKIKSKTGINSRHIALETETAVDIAQRACLKLFEHSSLKAEQVDFLVLMTESPDYILPPSSCVLHGRLGLPHSCGSFDINLGCSAYIYGLAVCKGLVSAGLAHNVLLVTAETYSKYINIMDKSTRTLFGDAATATWISTEGSIEISQFDFGTNGADFDKLIIPAGMARMPRSAETGIERTDSSGYTRSMEQLYMDGTGIFNFTIEVVPNTVKSLLDKEGLDGEDIGLYIFHQANEFMLSYLRKKIKISKERFYINMGDTGNTVSCSIPLAMKRSMLDGAFPQEGCVMLVGFGVGLSWGSVILRIGGGRL